MTAILSKFTVLCLCLSFYFVVYFLKLKLTLFYNKVVYYYTRIFLILLAHPVHIYIYIDKRSTTEKSFCIKRLLNVIIAEQVWNL